MSSTTGDEETESPSAAPDASWEVDIGSTNCSVAASKSPDTDADGLEDSWEMAHFQTLAAKPDEDANGDGESNMREYIQGTDPLAAFLPFELSYSEWKPGWTRIGWPSNPHASYDVLHSPTVEQPMTVQTNLPGKLDSMDWITSNTNLMSEFFQIRAEINLAP